MFFLFQCMWKHQICVNARPNCINTQTGSHGLGEEDEDRDSPPAAIGSCCAPPPLPMRRVAFASWASELRATAPSSGLLAMGMGVLAMGRTTLVTTVGATRTAPRTWVRAGWTKVRGGPGVPGAEATTVAGETESTPAALSTSPAPSSPALFLSEPSTLPPPPPSPPPPPLFPFDGVDVQCGPEGDEEGREERAAGWKPRWREERQKERSKGRWGGGTGISSLLWRTCNFLGWRKLWRITESITPRRQSHQIHP